MHLHLSVFYDHPTALKGANYPLLLLIMKQLMLLEVRVSSSMPHSQKETEQNWNPSPSDSRFSVCFSPLFQVKPL